MKEKWRVIEYKEPRVLRIVNENDNPIADLWLTGNDKDDKSVANLMAAAPDLLAACRMAMMLRQLGGIIPESRVVVDAVVEAAEAAIAKAKGAT